MNDGPLLQLTQDKFSWPAAIMLRLGIVFHDFIDGKKKLVVFLHVLKILENQFQGKRTY